MIRIKPNSLLYLCFCLLLTSNILAQKNVFSLRGNIKDALTGKPLVGASISIDFKKSGILSDSLGNYYLKLPEDEYVLKISYLGYKPFRLYIKLNRNLNVDAVLEDVTKQLEEVIV